MGDKYLVGFSVSPVQKFISTSRKTQDLYNASRFLSLIGEKIIEELEKRKANIIFPLLSASSNNKNSSVPNRVLAQFDISDNKINEELSEIKNHVTKYIEKTAIEVLHAVFKSPTEFAEKLVKRQISNYFVINYAAVPFKDNYKESYDLLSDIMSSYKNTRVFGQTAEEGIKCSLCGENEVIHYNRFGDSILKMREELNKSMKYINNNFKYLFADNEALCGVDLLKRAIHKVNNQSANKGGFEIRFPSTAEILTLHLEYGEKKQRNNLKEVKNYIEKSLGPITNAESTGQLLLKENIRKDYFRKNFGREIEDKLLREVKRVIGKYQEIEKLPRYYAVLMLDGDHMGKWMSGKMSKNNEGFDNLKDCQQSISRTLSQFNKNVIKYFNDNKGYGKLIYTGGDDVLAFVNINYIFKVIKDLRGMYPEKFSECGSKETPSCSIGICVAHYKEPMNFVLQKARLMEKKAKEKGKRNTFAIAVINKSGSVNEFVATNEKWKELDKIEDLVKRIDNKEISNKFIYTFLEETNFLGKAKLMDNSDDLQSDALIGSCEKEFNRLLLRSIKMKDKEKLSDELKLGNYYEIFWGDIVNALIMISSLAKLMGRSE